MADPIRILVVDDEAPQMQAICDILQDHHYACVGFTASRAALETLQPGRFDLMLTDLMMPELDGIAFLQAALRKDPDLIGIIMTGVGTVATAVEAMKAGAFDYILKPFRIKEILPVLARAFSVRKLRLENANLQRRVLERTAELENANQELASANKELESFSYSVSHDLRAPLRGIHGFTNILQQEHASQLTGDACDLLNRVVDNSLRMERLIDDLLRFSRLGKKPIVKQQIDTAILVREAVAEQMENRHDRKAEITIGYLPNCAGDAALLKQVFVNLISNAIKYTGKKEAAHIEVGYNADQEAYFVKDNGVGFDMRHAKKLFGVFQRLYPADGFEGTGIGLSIVQRILQRHGGRIWAHSETGKGATFYFTLPAADDGLDSTYPSGITKRRE